MKKEEFLEEFRKKISGLSPDDIEDRTSFYGEIIDEYISSGMSEEKAVAEIGTVDSAVEKILTEIPLSTLVKGKVKPKKAIKAWPIVLLICTFPIWLPLSITLIAVLFSLYIAVWAVLICFYAVDVSIAVVSMALLVVSILYWALGNPTCALLLTGGGSLCGSVTVLLLMGSVALTAGILKVTGRFFLALKSLFIGKEAGEN